MKLPRGTRWEAREGQVKGHMPQGSVGTSGTLHEEAFSPVLHMPSCAYSPHTTLHATPGEPRRQAGVHPAWEGPAQPPACLIMAEVKAGRVVLDSSLACV